MDNVNRYWVKWCLLSISSNDREKYEQLLYVLLDNVRESPSQKMLVSLLCESISDMDKNMGSTMAMFHLHCDGDFEELLHSHKQALDRPEISEVQGTCYKELGRYEEALTLLKRYPQNNAFCSSKTQLAYILVGLEEEASKIIVTIDFDGDSIRFIVIGNRSCLFRCRII